MNIDFVVTWVDDSDPAWAAEKEVYQKLEGASFDAWENGPGRFRDWGLFRYWFRAVERYAPWVRKIHLVTAGHFPAWLITDHPKIHLVRHRDFIPKEFLPTFNCNTIELNLHRIPGLSEHFVYFNDDVYLDRPVFPEDFFSEDGLPKLTPLAAPLTEAHFAAHLHMQFETIGMINQLYKGQLRRIMDEKRESWFPEEQEERKRVNQIAYEMNALPGMWSPHLAVPLRKSTMETAWEAISGGMKRTCRHRFRGPYDLIVQIFSLIEMMEGSFSAVPPEFYGKAFMDVRKTLNEVIVSLIRRTYRMICVNEPPKLTQEDFIYLKKELQAAFQTVLPETSKFEKLQ